jgi:MFS family permease
VSSGSFGAGDRDGEGLGPFRAGLFFAGANGVTWMVGLGSPMVLMAERLGADASQIGLASAFVFLVLPIQVLGTSTLSRLGYRRQMILGWGVRALFLAVPLGLALSAPEPPADWMPRIFVASVFGFCFFRAFGVAAYIPWLAKILPVLLRGRFFATEGLITSTVGVAVLLLSSALFARLQGYPAFAWMYALALAGAVLAILSLRHLPDAPRPGPIRVRSLHREARRLWFEPGEYRFYLGLSLLGSLVGSSLVPFATYYLRTEAEFSSSAIFAFTATTFAGQVAGVVGIRRVVDRAPLRRFFRIASLGLIAVEFFWLAYVAGAEGLEAGLPLAYFVLGIALAIHNTANATYLPELAPEERRPVALAVFTATLGMLSGLGPVVWGFVLKRSDSLPGMRVDRFLTFFVLGIIFQVLLFILQGRIRDRRGSDQAGDPPRSTPQRCG